MRSGVLYPLIFAALFTSGAASADKPSDEERAKEAFREAEEHYKEKKYKKALSGYEEAYDLTQAPLLLYNMAQCHRLLDHDEKALEHYKKFLDEDKSDSEFHDRAKEFVAEIEREAARAARKPEGRSPKRFALPGALAVAGAALGVAAFRQKQATADGLDRSGRIVGLSLAIGADASLVGAGVSAIFALKKGGKDAKSKRGKKAPPRKGGKRAEYPDNAFALGPEVTP
jgi:tetratricopeptide (TPR) repeat protein